MDKENFKFPIIKSKIPLPVEPLPCSSKEVLKKQFFENKRRPLKTLQDRTTNLPTNTEEFPKKDGKKKKLRKSVSLNIDTRHVTVRPKNENLDWDYKVFKDDVNNSVICISDDEVIEIASSSEQIKYFDSQCTKNSLGKTKDTETPDVSSSLLDPNNNVRNIKRSLKRPHSRIFHTSSTDPRTKEEGKQKRRIKISEGIHSTLKSPDVFKKLYADSFTRDYGFETFMYLLSKEEKWPKPRMTSSVTRACVINWLLKVNGPDGNPSIVHSATWYLDSILTINLVPLEKLQLIATACYWIAQKIHGKATTAQKLVKCSNFAFTQQYLLQAEKCILFKLKLPEQPILPQEFITYLSWWCDNDNPGEIELAATFICMSALILDTGMCEEYPSVIGAAAVRNALLLLRKRDLMEKLEMCSVFEAIEQKSNLYNICAIQRKAVRRLSSPMFEYRAPLELYSVGPCNIPEKILYEANYLAVVDTRIRPKISSKQDRLFKL